MAEAPGHRLGQIVGDVLEDAVEPILRGIARNYNLYLDRKGPRPARPGKKVTWVDNLGNAHDLDYVLERGGTEEKLGSPAGFIEVAWRRYTKHSRNKAQEIQGALVPLRDKYSRVRPFLGAILAGDFTEGSLQQLRSNMFGVAHIPTEEVARAFRKVGVDIGSGEDTPDNYLAEQVKKFEALDAPRRVLLTQEVRERGSGQLAEFEGELRTALQRRVERVTVVALHGKSEEFTGVLEAIRAIEAYSPSVQAHPFQKFEITVRYSNGDRITAEFSDGRSAIEFLQSFQGPSTPSVRFPKILDGRGT